MPEATATALPDVDLSETATISRADSSGIDFIFDDPSAGPDPSSVLPTIEMPRMSRALGGTGLILAEMTGARYHVAHISSMGAVRILRRGARGHPGAAPVALLLGHAGGGRARGADVAGPGQRGVVPGAVARGGDGELEAIQTARFQEPRHGHAAAFDEHPR